LYRGIIWPRGIDGARLYSRYSLDRGTLWPCTPGALAVAYDGLPPFNIFRRFIDAF